MQTLMQMSGFCSEPALEPGLVCVTLPKATSWCAALGQRLPALHLDLESVNQG